MQGLTVNIHYPEKNSVIDACGFTLKAVVALVNNPTVPLADDIATRHDKDFFTASLHVNGSNSNQDGLVAINAVIGDGKHLVSKRCGDVCGFIGPQGDLVSAGPYSKVRLAPDAQIDVWPNFGCQKWRTLPDISFSSAAIGGRRVIARARMPAAHQENRLARPSSQLPPILFRLNSEWYWPDAGEEYGHWHSLMVDGLMEPFVVVEVGEENVTRREWARQPIFTSKPIRQTCGVCEDDIKFVCRGWEAYAPKYVGKEHFFGSAAQFFTELWHSVVPRLLDTLPSRTDVAQPFEPQQLRVGVWGYCIGGLGAWNAITLKPGLYNMAYMGSPAVDFNCGEALEMAKQVSLGDGSTRPNVYIDVGALESEQSIRQARLLFGRLHDQGHHVQFAVAPMGTHQGRILLKRAQVGLLALFGSDVTRQNFADGPDEREHPPPRGSAFQPPIIPCLGGLAVFSFFSGVFVQHRCATRGKHCIKGSGTFPLLHGESADIYARPITVAV